MDGLLDYRDTLGHSNGCDLIRIKLLARRRHELVDMDISSDTYDGLGNRFGSGARRLERNSILWMI